jgi:hypothetical protein
MFCLHVWTYHCICTYVKSHKPLLLSTYKFWHIFSIAPLHEVFKILLNFEWWFLHEVLYERRFMMASLAGGRIVGGLLLMSWCFLCVNVVGTTRSLCVWWWSKHFECRACGFLYSGGIPSTWLRRGRCDFDVARTILYVASRCFRWHQWDQIVYNMPELLQLFGDSVG